MARTEKKPSPRQVRQDTPGTLNLETDEGSKEYKGHVGQESEDTDVTYNYKEPENVSFAYRAKERITNLWNSEKYIFKPLCWVTLNIGLLMIAAVATVLLVTHFSPGNQEVYSLNNQAGHVNNQSTPRWTTFYQKDISTIIYPTLPSTLLELKQISTDLHATTEPIPITLTSLKTTDINDCTRKPCEHGTCVNEDGGYNCTCSPGWTGQNCQQDINECIKNPCQQGTCVNKAGGFRCTCSTGWTGQNCQQDINECTTNPCQHGTCVNKDGGYKCTCSSGWTGQNCQQDINECIRTPCQHGTCVNQDGGYKCTCSPGWTGDNCHQDFNECTRKPCQHGTCVNKAGGYTCTCSPGWTGQNCLQDLNECTRNPCQHGTCVNKDGGYKCTCSPGWTGQNCQQDINECTRKPCQHGTCVNKDGGYKCTCSPGWTGQNCQQDISACNRNPCRYGRCENTSNGYKCTCHLGWIGKRCQILDPMANIQCRSGWSEYNNHRYKFMTSKVSWNQANSLCKILGANLVSIHSREENEFIKRLITNAPGGEQAVVSIGLRKNENGQWEWSDGSRVSYTNWAPGEPNNVGMWSLDTWCSAMSSKSGREWFWGEHREKGKWTDQRCSGREHGFSYICKTPK